jgi:Meiotically up-regulated gene 113
MIYLLHAPDERLVKIGYSAARNGIGQRVRNQIRADAGRRRLVLFGVMDGNRAHESKLHKRYAEHRQGKTEWFNDTILSELALVCTRAEFY